MLSLFGWTNDYNDNGFRECDMTGLKVHRSAEIQVMRFVLTAVVALIVGGFFALLVALTRWEAVGLLEADMFYTALSIHAWNLLIFWMVFTEIAILYVGGPFVLGRKLSLSSLATVGWTVMVGSAVWINYAIWTTQYPNQQPLLTSYPPLPSSWQFYLGVIVFLLGTIVAALPFFATIFNEKWENPSKTLPLVAFGAFICSIIALEALLGGLITYIPTFLWRVGIFESIDAAWYRQVYWIIGHGSQQINLVAMITIWYFITYYVGGAVMASEKVSRIAFVLYLFFINMGAAHHLMSDPAVSASWRVWNTSYAAYGAVVASMIHAFAIPAGLEVGRRQKGKGRGLFTWLTSAPWKDPGFSSIFLSFLMFGFLGGITGVVLGQMQINMTWHNTLAVPGHFHATVATGTTLAFMGFIYYGIRLVFRREWVGRFWAMIQPYLYGATMGIVVLMMMYVGVLYGVPRRHPSVMDIPGTEFSFSAAQPLFTIWGSLAVLAVISGAIFVVVALLSLLFGSEVDPEKVKDEADAIGTDYPDKESHEYSMQGTFVLTIIFLAAFGTLYFLNWYLVSQLWHIGA
ncbi:MAG: cbb3-type cytochrome c oxidase subunit I [bacterium]